MTIESSRLAGVQTPVIPIVSRWIAETPGTLSLGQGIVSYGPPIEALEAARTRAVADADHRYGPVEGEAELVAALEAKLEAENGIAVRPHSRVIVTAGGNLAFMNAVLAIADPGDEFILPTPYYFNHEMAITMASGRVVGVPTRADRQLDLDAIAAAITPRTRAIVTVSPNNPTGAVYPESDLREVNALCARRNLVHVNDEAYEYFVYDEARHFSPGSIDGAAAHTISLYSFSKAYGMAAWRMGYMVAPAALWDAINKIQDTILICPPSASQAAARAAIGVGPAWAGRALPTLDAMRRLMYERLSAGVPCLVPKPSGAFYYFLEVQADRDPLAVTERLIREHRVAVIPGSAFGARGCTLRVSFGALDPATAAEGAARLARGLRDIAG